MTRFAGIKPPAMRSSKKKLTDFNSKQCFNSKQWFNIIGACDWVHFQWGFFKISFKIEIFQLPPVFNNHRLLFGTLIL